MPVCTVFPFQRMSRGRPTFTDSRRAIFRPPFPFGDSTRRPPRTFALPEPAPRLSTRPSGRHQGSRGCTALDGCGPEANVEHGALTLTRVLLSSAGVGYFEYE